MKSKIIYLYGLFLGIFFLLFTIFISDNSHLITKAYKTVENLCEKIRNKEICFVLFSQSNFEKIEFIKKSKAFTNNQVPLIKIYLTEVELKTLKNIALSTLRNNRVMDKPYKWVTGKIIFNNKPYYLLLFSHSKKLSMSSFIESYIHAIRAISSIKPVTGIKSGIRSTG